jgi:hypothetical protein
LIRPLHDRSASSISDRWAVTDTRLMVHDGGLFWIPVSKLERAHETLKAQRQSSDAIGSDFYRTLSA